MKNLMHQQQNQKSEKIFLYIIAGVAALLFILMFLYPRLSTDPKIEQQIENLGPDKATAQTSTEVNPPNFPTTVPQESIEKSEDMNPDTTLPALPPTVPSTNPPTMPNTWPNATTPEPTDPNERRLWQLEQQRLWQEQQRMNQQNIDQQRQQQTNPSAFPPTQTPTEGR